MDRPGEQQALPFTRPAAFAVCLELALALGGVCGEPRFSALLEELCLQSDRELWFTLEPLAKQGIVSISRGDRLVHLLEGGWARLAAYDAGAAAIKALQPGREGLAFRLESLGKTIVDKPPAICRRLTWDNPPVTDAGQALGLICLGRWERRIEFRKGQSHGRWLLSLLDCPLNHRRTPSGREARGDPLGLRAPFVF